MYESFFGLNEAPFTLTPNTHFFLKSETHQRGLEMLLVALQNKEGFIKISGEVGTGKTLLCRKLLNALDDTYITAYIPNPHFSAESLYCVLANELSGELAACQQRAQPLGPESRKQEGSLQENPQKSPQETSNQSSGYFNQDLTGEKYVLALQRINECLIQFAKNGKQVVLIIDEAQSMPDETIEALRLLTNLETESEKLLQVVLFGQPELDLMLQKKHLRQLQQRITFQHRIQPLNRKDIEQYISHRMLLAGYRGGRLFEAKAITLLTRASKGIPRLVNVLCHKALMSAYGKGSKIVLRQHMNAAIRDTESVDMPFWQRFTWSLSALVVYGATCASDMPASYISMQAVNIGLML
jgi:MSHA biogenesis protein MshM